MKLVIIEDSEVLTSPLEVLTDRWNSTLIAWKRVLELHNAMHLVSTKLLSNGDSKSEIMSNSR